MQRIIKALRENAYPGNPIDQHSHLSAKRRFAERTPIVAAVSLVFEIQSCGLRIAFRPKVFAQSPGMEKRQWVLAKPSDLTRIHISSMLYMISSYMSDN
jgi:hypothetical protein